MEPIDMPPLRSVRITRRRMLTMVGAMAGTGLLAASGAGSVIARADALPQAIADVLARSAQPAHPPKRSLLDQANQNSFVPINSALTFGPPTDLASGWDGTIWAIDSAGAPHTYDSTSDSWQLFGSGIDAAALAGEDSGGIPVYFRGSEVFIADGRHAGPQPIGTMWPYLPPSFKLGVSGATYADGQLYLFRGATYVGVPWGNSAAPLPAGGVVAKLVTSLARDANEWPASDNWKDGVIDAVYTRGTFGGVALFFLIRGNEYITATLNQTGSSTSGPTPMSLDPSVQGMDGGFEANGLSYVFRGAQVNFPSGFGSQLPPELLPPVTTTPSPTTPRAPEASATPTTARTPEATATAPATPTSEATGTPRPAADLAGLFFAPLLSAATSTTTPTPSPTAAYLSTPTGTPTSVGARTPTPSPSLTVAGTATPSASPTPASSGTPTSTSSSTPTATVTPIGSATPAASVTPVGSATPTASATPVGSPTPDGTPSPSPTGTPTAVDPATTGATPGLPLRSADGATYIATAAQGWPATWHPILQHAPSGRVGGLWAATMSGAVVSHDGNTWTLQPGDAISVSAGSDGSVFSIGFKNNRQLSQWTGSNWNAVAQHASALSQVAVGDQSRVWLRDSGNVVHQLQQGQLQPAPLLGARAHLAANTDGTVWSCTGSDSNADRFISEATATPQSIPIQAQATVHKVASTGFGTAHCLVQQDGTPQLYRYQSPYLFKTSETYQVVTPNTIDAGLGSIYFTVATGPGGNSGPYYVVALDAHTGQELSRSAPGSSAYTPPVFDARHDVVIVGAGNQMLGLDARDLTQVRWALTPQADTGPMSIGPARPTLRGQLLALTDNIATVALYQLGATADAAPTKLWSSSMAIAPQDTHQLAPPVIAGGNVYAAWWVRATIDGYQQLWLFAFDAASGAATRTKLDPTFGYDTSQFHSLGMFTPVLVEVPASQSGAAHVYLLVNGGGSAWRVDVASPDATQKYGLPGSNYITSGFSVANGVVWFGDNAASLYGVDVNQLKAVANTPQSYSPAGETQPIYTTPVVYQDPLGDEVVLVSAFNPSAPTASGTGLVAFSPSTGTTATIPAGTTALSTLSPAVINGVIYAAGYNGLSNGATALPSQVFAIRVDQAVQDLRDFIIDSQLMQDFDGASTPNGVARYQTHLTLVDDTKAPIPNEPIKLWADQSTHISVGGQNYSVGPADEQYAALKTAADGTLTIVSDAADMWTPPLRVWAAFMDPFERIMIYRDREFHNRVATAHAANDGQNGAADPTRVNLQAVTTYGAIQKGGVSGPELFTADQKTHNQPQQVANAIQTMTKSVGTSKGSGGSTPKAAWSLHTTLDTAKYIPYADLPGSQYSAVNTPAVRPVVVLQTAGLSYAKADDNADTQPALTALTPAAATLAIDALQGAEWTSSSLASPRVTAAARAGALHLGSWFSDFWDWVKGAAATITHVVVSVAEDIYTGIRVLVDGVAHVFRAIITGLEEAVSAIGAFFVELGHLIEDVIEALSILFHFEEIIKTHNILKSELLSRVNTFPTTVSGSVVPALNTFFNTSEQEIAGYLNGWADKIAGSPGGSGPPVTTLKGSGATAHSTFTVSPSGGGQSSSHAVQSTWGLRKLNGAIGIDGAASLSTALAQSPGAGGTVSDFFTGFAARLSGDGNLSAQWAKVQAGANGLAHPSSAADFVKQSLAELLRTLALILDGAVSVGAAFLIGDNGAGGLLGLIGTLLEQMVGDGGLLTTDPQIPVLSWLYQELFGEPLTFVNALLLVAAIPVTVLWKVVKGQWPSESLPQSTAATAVAGGLQTPPPLLAELIGITGGVLSVVLGFVYGAGDILGADPDVPLVLGRMALAGSLLAMACSFPLASNNSPSYYDWYGWGIGLGIALLNIVGSVNNPEPLATQITYVFPLILSVSNLLLAAVLGVVVAQEYPDADPLAKASVVISLMATLPGLANPLKLVDELLAIVVAALDVVMGFASGSVQLAGAFT